MLYMHSRWVVSGDLQLRVCSWDANTFMILSPCTSFHHRYTVHRGVSCRMFQGSSQNIDPCRESHQYSHSPYDRGSGAAVEYVSVMVHSLWWNSRDSTRRVASSFIRDSLRHQGSENDLARLSPLRVLRPLSTQPVPGYKNSRRDDRVKTRYAVRMDRTCLSGQSKKHVGETWVPVSIRVSRDVLVLMHQLMDAHGECEEGSFREMRESHEILIP